MSFSSLGLHPGLLRSVHELGFARPTAIQQEAIPPAMEGRDVLGTASTGSGKTAAFLLPILHRLIAKRRGATRALVLTPTRELAAQVADHLAELAIHTPLTGAAIFGGVGMGPQEHALRSGFDVIVATPGRLLDHLRAPYAQLRELEVLVVDEADRMLDMGFLPDVRRILRHLPPRRQTLFFSATMPPAIAQLTREILKNPVVIQHEREARPAVGITQAVYPVTQDRKSSLLLELLRRGDVKNVLVFTRTKHRANRLADFLDRERVSAGRIHGNRSQGQRTAALDAFRAGRIRVLVATDIAARGIDVEALSHVINFDVPRTPDDYVHRVGRTGRAEMTGDAFTFVAPDETSLLREIERTLGKPLPRVHLEGFDAMATIEEPRHGPMAQRLHSLRGRAHGGRPGGPPGGRRGGRPGGGRPGGGRPGGGRPGGRRHGPGGGGGGGGGRTPYSGRG